MLAPSILASVTNSRRFDILDPTLNGIEQLPFAAHSALLWVSTMSPATCPPCLRYVQSSPAGSARVPPPTRQDSKHLLITATPAQASHSAAGTPPSQPARRQRSGRERRANA